MGQEDGWRGEIASIMRERERGMGWGFQQDFALQSLPGSAADCARMHASKQGMRDESTRRASTVRARDVRQDGSRGWVGEAR